MAVSNWKPCVCLRMRVLGAAARAVDECTLHCTHWSAFLPRLSYRTHSHVRNVYSRKLINVHMPLFRANKALAVHLQCSTARVGLCNQSIRSQVWHCARSQNAVEIISANKMNAKLIVCVACKNAESAEVLNAAIALLFMFAERQRILLSFFYLAFSSTARTKRCPWSLLIPGSEKWNIKCHFFLIENRKINVKISAVLCSEYVDFWCCRCVLLSMHRRRALCVLAYNQRKHMILISRTVDFMMTTNDRFENNNTFCMCFSSILVLHCERCRL